MSRPDWDTYFFDIARNVSQRATCPSRKVGCVIVDDNTKQILSTGYNGAPRGTSHCDDSCRRRESGSDFRKCKAVHAELNAIVNAAFNGVELKNSLMYLTCAPCIFCSRTIINAGIKQVKANSRYSHDDAIDLLHEGGVKLEIISGVTFPGIHRDENMQ